MPEDIPPLSFDDIELVSERVLGTLGRVFIVQRKTGESPGEADPWLGLSRLALRPLVPEGDETADAVARLRADVEALVPLEHPSLLRVIGIGRRRDAELVALELPSSVKAADNAAGKAAGEGARETATSAWTHLGALIAARELTPARAVAVAHSVASALGAVASTGRFHADLTSSCVFLPGPSTSSPAGGGSGEPGRVKVLPFALPPDRRVDHRACPHGFYRGTVEYAAPELHRDAGRHPTEKSNIFAFGVMFYEMLAGQPPFRRGTPTRVLLDIAEATPAPPSAQARGPAQGIPEDLDRLCMRCLERDPERRFPNFAAVEASLRIAAETVAFAGDGESTRPLAAAPGRDAAGTARTAPLATARRSSARRVRSAFWQVGIFAASAVVVLAAVALLLLSGKTPDEGEPERAEAGYDAVGRAEELIAEGKPEEAMLLLEAHPQARDVDAEAYDRAKHKAEARGLLLGARLASARGDWSAALGVYDELAALEGPTEKVRSERDLAAFHVGLERAESAAAAGELQKAVDALEEASRLAPGIPLRNLDRDRVQHGLKLVRLIVDSDAAGAKGDEASRRELLFQALLAAEEGDPYRSAVESRLAGISAGPDAGAEAVARARTALAAGDLGTAAEWAATARERWPYAPEPGAILTYLADRRFCENAGTVFVSPHAPGETWGADERGSSFCMDRYEYPGREGELPSTGVSAIEAAARCRERGARLCTLKEWRLACGGSAGGGGGLAYPYGDRYVRDRCNTEGRGLEPCGSRPGCRSPYGVHDMSGNAAEWTGEVVDGAQLVVGGDWGGGEAFTRSDSAARFNPGLTSPRVGFRCCRTLPEREEDAPPAGRGGGND